MSKIIIFLFGFMVCCNYNQPQSIQNEKAKDFEDSQISNLPGIHNQSGNHILNHNDQEIEISEVRQYDMGAKTNGAYSRDTFFSELPNVKVLIEPIFYDSLSIVDTASGVAGGRRILDITTAKDYYVRLNLSNDHFQKQFYITRGDFKDCLPKRLIQKGQISLCMDIDSLSIDTILTLKTRINYPFSDIGILFQYQIKPDGKKEILKYEKFTPD